MDTISGTEDGGILSMSREDLLRCWIGSEVPMDTISGKHTNNHPCLAFFVRQGWFHSASMKYLFLFDQDQWNLAKFMCYDAHR